MKKFIGILNLLSIILLTFCSCNSGSGILKNFSQQWGLYNNGQTINGTKGVKGIDINILKAWELSKGSEDVIIGMLDAGIDTNCIEYKDNIFINKSEIPNNGIDDDQNGFIDDISGWNFYQNSNQIYDNYLHDYHGTYLSGIIAASEEGDNMKGIAPKVKILPLKFLQGSTGDTKDAIKAIEYAYSLGVRIINCSWDTKTYDLDLEKTMSKYSDILFICSAGKSKENLEVSPVYPACYDLPNIVSVAAIDNRGCLYEYSGYGNKADVAAPGVDIYSLMPDGNYTYSSGTSAATAYVTGVAALIKSYRPDLSSTQIATIIKQNTKKIDSLEGKVSSCGIVDAYQCLKCTENMM